MNGKRILVPLNLEHDSLDGLEFLAGLTVEMPVVATLLYVNPLNIYPPSCRVYDELSRESERRMRQLAKLFFDGPLPHVSVRAGKPHEEILSEAEASQAELIVMTSSKMPRRRWQLWPTTVERVVRESPCLTLVLPRVWKITPEQFRQAMRPAAVVSQPDFSYQ